MMSENMGQDPGPRQEEKYTGAFSHTRHSMKMPTSMITSESISLIYRDCDLKQNDDRDRTTPMMLARIKD